MLELVDWITVSGGDSLGTNSNKKVTLLGTQQEKWPRIAPVTHCAPVGQDVMIALSHRESKESTDDINYTKL